MESYRNKTSGKSSLSSKMNRLKKLTAQHINNNNNTSSSSSSLELEQLKLRNPQDQQSDSESSSESEGSPKKRIGFFGEEDGLVKLEQGTQGYNIIDKAFVSGMGSLGKHTDVVGMYKNSFSSFSGQTRLQSFRIFSDSIKRKCGSNGGNVKFAWYGSSKQGVYRILNYGFTHCGNSENSGTYGYGIYLSPHNSPLESAMSRPADEDGLRHVVLCRVILGNMEEIDPGSNQTYPSSKVYDSGVDNIGYPRKYIVWTTNMNTHILPEYVVSFKVKLPPSLPPSSSGMQEPVVGGPKSPWMAFPALLSALSMFLPPNTISLLQQYHRQFHERKLTRIQLIKCVRRVVGDKLLISVIKSFREKQHKETNVSSPISTAVTGICSAN